MHNRVFVCLFLYAKKIAEVQAFQSHSKKENTPFTRTFFQCSVNEPQIERVAEKNSRSRPRTLEKAREGEQSRRRLSIRLMLVWLSTFWRPTVGSTGCSLNLRSYSVLRYRFLFVEIGVSFSETFDLRIVLTIYSFSKTFLFRYKLATFRRGSSLLFGCFSRNTALKCTIYFSFCQMYQMPVPSIFSQFI